MTDESSVAVSSAKLAVTLLHLASYDYDAHGV